MATRIPPLLERYLALPPETSQLVLTGILGACTNWLVLRYLCSLMRGITPKAAQDGSASGKPEQVKLLLVSFMRDYAFWKENAGRLGLDLDPLLAQRQVVFVDGLSRLYAGGRAGPVVVAASSSGHVVLASARVSDVARVLLAAVDSLAQGAEAPAKVVLVLDAPDAWLAAGGEGVCASAVRDLVLDLREKVHASIVTVAADEPLIASQTTALEKEHAIFALSLAHEAEAVLSLRMLDTGPAKDVSGIIRITRGGGGDSLEAGRIEEHEYLYHVGADGGVKVFERGQ